MIKQTAAGMAIIAAMAASPTPARPAGPVSVPFTEAQIGALPMGFATERTGSGAPAEWNGVSSTRSPATPGP